MKKMLSADELKKLPTKRLLSFYKKVRSYYKGYIAGHYCECCGTPTYDLYAKLETNEEYKKNKIQWEKEIHDAENYLTLIKSILNTREHIKR